MSNPQKENGYTAISNEIMEALGKTRIPGEARQMLDVIIRKTYGFNKKADSIATSQFMDFTGLSHIAIYKARRKLKEMNIITISKKGERQTLIYSFQKDYDKWKLSPKKELSPKKDYTISKKGEGYLQKRSKTVSQKVIYKRHKVDITKDTTTKDIIEGSKEPSHTNQAFNYFCFKYKEVFNKEYIASFAKDKRILKDLLVKIPIENLTKLMDIFLTTPDQFCETAGYTIGVFKTRINSLRTDKLTFKVSDKTVKSMQAANNWANKGEIIDVKQN